MRITQQMDRVTSVSFLDLLTRYVFIIDRNTVRQNDDQLWDRFFSEMSELAQATIDLCSKKVFDKHDFDHFIDEVCDYTYFLTATFLKKEGRSLVNDFTIIRMEWYKSFIEDSLNSFFTNHFTTICKAKGIKAPAYMRTERIKIDFESLILSGYAKMLRRDNFREVKYGVRK